MWLQRLVTILETRWAVFSTGTIDTRNDRRQERRRQELWTVRMTGMALEVSRMRRVTPPIPRQTVSCHHHSPMSAFVRIKVAFFMLVICYFRGLLNSHCHNVSPADSEPNKRVKQRSLGMGVLRYFHFHALGIKRHYIHTGTHKYTHSYTQHFLPPSLPFSIPSYGRYPFFYLPLITPQSESQPLLQLRYFPF